MKIVKGQITKPAGKTFETKYGEKRMAIVTLVDGTEEKFYLVPHHDACNLQKGSAVSVVYEERNGRTVRRIVPEETNETTSAYTRSPDSGRSNNYYSRGNGGQQHKPQTDPREWATVEARNIIALMNIVSTEATNGGFPDLTSDELRNIAISINISAQRKFNDQVDFYKDPIEAKKEELESPTPDEDQNPFM